MTAPIGTDIENAALLLRQGELVAIPTETVYGLAANALNEEAVIKIFEAKKRPHFDPLIVHIPGIEYLEQYASYIPATAMKLAKAFWPGPLTLILPKKEIIPDLVTSGQETVGLRVPRHTLTLSLLKKLDFPLAAPSANPFGYISPTSASHVAKQLGDNISYILEGGSSEVGIESTIVGFDHDNPVVYRLGGISMEDIKSITGDIEIQLNASSNPAAPGQLLSHYAPQKKLYVGDIDTLIQKFAKKSVAVISFTKSFKHPAIMHCWVLSENGSLNEAAKNLFKALREADEMDIDIILTEIFPEKGLGMAINDRLRRASFRM
jgi:L-threonylcarbamoyladenylate synthase